MLAGDLASMYSGGQDVDAVVTAYYNVDAIFEDPLVSVKGRKHIAAQFRGLRWMVSSVKYETLSVTHGTRMEGANSICDDNHTLVINAKVTFFFWLLPLMIHVHTVCALSEATGKICRHGDFWDIRSLFENIPFWRARIAVFVKFWVMSPLCVLSW